MAISPDQSGSDAYVDIPWNLISDSPTLQDQLLRLHSAAILGIDCETTGLNPHTNQIRLIQLAVPNQPVIIIDLFKISKIDSFFIQQILSGSVLKIFHNGKFDWQFLTQAGLQPKEPFFDTQIAYRVLTEGLKTGLSLQTLAHKLLNIELDKAQQVSNWNKPLTEKQLQYAALDASILLDLYPILYKKLARSRLFSVLSFLSTLLAEG
jgi:DNA polymerase-1